MPSQAAGEKGSSSMTSRLYAPSATSHLTGQRARHHDWRYAAEPIPHQSQHRVAQQGCGNNAGFVVTSTLSMLVIGLSWAASCSASMPCAPSAQASMVITKAVSATLHSDLCTRAALTPSCMRTAASWGARRAA